MGNIVITKSDGSSLVVKGAFTFQASIDMKTNVIDISGVMTIDGDYIDDAIKISNDRYEIEGVRIYSETYGSDTNEITYSFKATDYSINL